MQYAATSLGFAFWYIFHRLNTRTIIVQRSVCPLISFNKVLSSFFIVNGNDDIGENVEVVILEERYHVTLYIYIYKKWLVDWSKNKRALYIDS